MSRLVSLRRLLYTLRYMLLGASGTFVWWQLLQLVFPVDAGWLFYPAAFINSQMCFEIDRRILKGVS